MKSMRTVSAGERDVVLFHCPQAAQGMALLEVPVQDLKRFVQETETLVPRGSESERTDSDVLLRHLLAEG